VLKLKNNNINHQLYYRLTISLLSLDGVNMGSLKNALRRVIKTDFLKNKHEDCANFDDGTCKFFHFTNLDPKGQACPHFKAKEKT